MTTPTYINPVQWQQSLAFARQECARVFRDGGTPTDALAAFGLSREAAEGQADWARVVEQIASELCAHPVRLAA